ncbi:MAG: tRNA (N(6)-L-threonylcarbamoyladenosine(37)-C(2))-methylthiotransferase MtaB [Chloroflexota bacterium]
MRVFLTTLGCRVNQAELDSFAQELIAAGHIPVSSPDAADVCVINTCAVTTESERKSRQRIRWMKRSNGDARMLVTGCYATLAPTSIRDIAIDLECVPNTEKPQLLGYLPQPDVVAEMCPTTYRGRTRAFVKVQDGCDNHCTYCITRIARGKSKSHTVREVINEVQNLVEKEYNEVILCGIDLGSYRDPGSGAKLTQLLSELIAQTPIERIRLSSLEPWSVTPDLLDMFTHERVCPSLHLPLQSGSKRILERMARKTSPEEYTELAIHAKSTIPDLSLSTDLITGFPDETDQDHSDTVDLVKRVGFSHIHVFPFSPRPGTAAANYPNRVENTLIRKRSSQLREIGKQQSEFFAETYLHQTLEILWESPTVIEDKCYWKGHSKNNILCLLRSDDDMRNRVTPAMAHKRKGSSLVVQLVS